MIKFLALLTFFIEPWHVDTVETPHGRYSRGAVQEAELIIPHRLHPDGSFKSYELPEYYDRRYESSGRGRRSTEDKPHLALKLRGVDHHIELEPYHEFISPELVVETRGAGIATDLNEGLRFSRLPDRQCHYRGTVRGHDNSRAALSLCDGVAGYVQTNHGRYFIEPLHESEPKPDGQHAHIAYTREANHQSTGKDLPSKRHCEVDDNWELAWAEQLAKRERRALMQRQRQEQRQRVDETKRSAPVSSGTHSIHRYIELGLVADRRFLDFHNNTNYEQYLLTVMNMVSDFYHDTSSGNQIDVVLVRVIYLEKENEEIDLLISPAAEETLDSFSKWAYKMNPKDPHHPNHYDIAALVTRYDICSEGTNCDLMGLAYVAAACDPNKAAAINEDSGLLLGVVLAHEIGHVMGCSHDEEETSGCSSQDEDKSYFVMSPIVFIYTIRWSSCSKKFMTSFLESGLGECLNNDPRSPPDRFRYPNMLPGAMYEADFQCDMTFKDSTKCKQSPINDCELLWCHANSSCYSMGSPPADGTKCGENKWCIHKKCVDIGTRPSAVHGGWGGWGPMSSCTRTCGGGIKYSERECNRPVPANGGRYCLGERKRMQTCNTTPCDPFQPSYRALQCTEQDKETVLTDGLLHTWKPYYQPDLEPCALYCINEERTFVKISPSANDSTPCKFGTNYMCLGGACRKVGCDWIIDSDAIDDKCGICKGDGTKCSPVEGDFTTVDKNGYVKIVTIPKGARSISIAEKEPCRNILAVKLDKNDTYCLNANNHEQKSGDYECAGTTLLYLHPEKEKEEIEIKGPISEDIQIQYVYFRPKLNPGVHYKYYVMSTDPSYIPKYTWDFVDWSECNVKCGGGTMTSEATCIEEKGGKVTPNFCEDTPRPESKSRVCNPEPCPAKWRVSQWSKCSACDGHKGKKHRKVQCVRPAARPGEDDVQANLDACKGRVPRQEEECVGKRPCKKMCPKKTRDCDSSKFYERRKTSDLSLADQNRIIENYVYLGLRKYLDKASGALTGESYSESSNAANEFRRLVRDLALADSIKYKRTCPKENSFTTPKPGSIIKDVVPMSQVVLKEAPVTQEFLQANLSDKAYKEIGDAVGEGIDTSEEKIFTGSDAIRKIGELSYRVNKNRTSISR